MHWWARWQILWALLALGWGQGMMPTMCEEESCRCNSFSSLMCNCTEGQEVILRPVGAYRVPLKTTAIIINGCGGVRFLPKTVRELTHLRDVVIRNSQNVVIDEEGLAWSPFSRYELGVPGITILIENSTITEISGHAIQGQIKDITLNHNRIVHIKPFAFSNMIDLKNMLLIENEFENADRSFQAFKQFATRTFQITRGTLGILPSRFISNVEVIDLFRMNGVTVDTVNSMSFYVNLPKRVIIENNDISTLQGDGFLISMRGPVTFRNNTVGTISAGAFHGFSVHGDTVWASGRQELLLDNNTVTELLPSALTYNNTLTMRIDGLKLNRSCSCELTDEWKSMILEHGGSVFCWYSLENHYVSLSSFINNRCGLFKQTFWIYVVVSLIIVIILAVAVTLWWVRRQNNNQRHNVQIVMPDGKTYRETEIYILERAELLTTDL